MDFHKFLNLWIVKLEGFGKAHTLLANRVQLGFPNKNYNVTKYLFYNFYICVSQILKAHGYEISSQQLLNCKSDNKTIRIFSNYKILA